MLTKFIKWLEDTGIQYEFTEQFIDVSTRRASDCVRIRIPYKQSFISVHSILGEIYNIYIVYPETGTIFWDSKSFHEELDGSIDSAKKLTLKLIELIKGHYE